MGRYHVQGPLLDPCWRASGDERRVADARFSRPGDWNDEWSQTVAWGRGVISVDGVAAVPCMRPLPLAGTSSDATMLAPFSAVSAACLSALDAPAQQRDMP